MSDTGKRFRVAFSFAGEKRDFVAQVAAILAARFSKAEILYDKYHEAEFARRDLGFYLPDLYHNQSDLVIVVVCRDYQQKEWCGLEWHAIFGLLKERKDREVMLCRFDHAIVQGLYGIAGFVELDEKTPDQAATLILERLALNEGNVGVGGATSTVAEQERRNASINAASKPVVITLHGIRTRGKWQKDLDTCLSRAGFTPESLDYGWFSVMPFLFKNQREKKVRWFLDEYQRIRNQNPGIVPSLIAHSFGTYIAAKAIALYGGMIKFERMIFCGSIVPVDFEWSKLIDAGVVKEVLNDYGHLDVWAGNAGLAISDAGPSGKRGFNDAANGKVDQRCHPEWGHGHFFFELNYKERWIPFLKNEQFIDVTLKPHFHVPLVWILLLLVFAFGIASLWIDQQQRARIYNGIKASPTPVLSATPMSTLSSTPTSPDYPPPAFPKEIGEPKAVRDSHGKPELSLDYRIGPWPSGYELGIEAFDNSNLSGDSNVADEKITIPSDVKEIKPLIALKREPHTPTVWYRFVIRYLQRPPLFGPVRSLDVPPIQSK